MNWHDLVRRVREGDSQASADLYEKLKPALLPILERWLDGSSAQRMLDPTEVMHSAIRRLLQEDRTPDQPLAWLTRVAQRIILAQGRSHSISRTESIDSTNANDSVDPGSSPDEQVEDREWVALLIARFRERLTPEVYRSFTRRSEGASWAEVTQECAPEGTSVEAWRKKCQRKAQECWDRMKPESDTD